MSTIIYSAEWYTNPPNHGVVFISPVEPGPPAQAHVNVDRDADWMSSDEPFYILLAEPQQVSTIHVYP